MWHKLPKHLAVGAAALTGMAAAIAVEAGELPQTSSAAMPGFMALWPVSNDTNLHVPDGGTILLGGQRRTRVPGGQEGGTDDSSSARPQDASSFGYPEVEDNGVYWRDDAGAGRASPGR